MQIASFVCNLRVCLCVSAFGLLRFGFWSSVFAIATAFTLCLCVSLYVRHFSGIGMDPCATEVSLTWQLFGLQSRPFNLMHYSTQTIWALQSGVDANADTNTNTYQLMPNDMP